MEHKQIDMLATAQMLQQKFQELGMSNLDISNEFDVSLSTVHYWLKGKKMPSLYHFVAIAGVLHCGLDDLVIIAE